MTPAQEYILNNALLEAEKIYYRESNGARLEVIGTKLSEGKNGTNFKRDNMKIERERSAPQKTTTQNTEY